MKSKLVVRPDAADGSRKTRGRKKSRPKLPFSEDQLMDMVLSIAYPLTPREHRKNNKCEYHYTLSPREVMPELSKKHGIHLSTQKISSIVRNAFDRRRARVLFDRSDEAREADELAGRLRQHFGLPGAVLVVPGDPRMLDPEITPHEHRAIHGDIILKMVAVAARYIEGLLEVAAGKPRPADALTYTMALAWGWTTQALGDEWVRSHRRGPQPSPFRIQAGIGTSGPQNLGPAEANVNVNRLAPVFGATAAEMPNEAIVRREDYAAVRVRLAVARAHQAIENADIFVSSLGRVLPVGQGSDYRISRDPQINDAAIEDAYACGAMADLCTVLIDSEGRPVTRAKFVGVGPTYKGLQAMVRDRDRHLIIIAGGSRERMYALRAAIRGHLVGDLITDSVTAKWLLSPAQD